MIRLKANNQRFTLPSGPEDISLGMFCDFLNGETELKRLSILTGLNEGTLSRVSDTNLDTEIYSRLFWLNPEQIVKMLEAEVPPRYIEINGKEYNVRHPEEDTLGKKLEAKALLANSEGKLKVEVFAGLIQVYTGADLEYIAKLPLTVAYPVGNFFLSRFQHFVSGGTISFAARATQEKN